jgi:hypothetical protein
MHKTERSSRGDRLSGSWNCKTYIYMGTDLPYILHGSLCWVTYHGRSVVNNFLPWPLSQSEMKSLAMNNEEKMQEVDESGELGRGAYNSPAQ